MQRFDGNGLRKCCGHSAIAGPRDLVKRTLMSLLWTVVAVIGLMLIGLLFQILKLP